ncbi:MAG TPA: aldehyde dehydrogenase family protein, partial [Burkholderiales bacterium]|nr:aldehyde dehydrogenase family protein [Burkholderiales bacterium]
MSSPISPRSAPSHSRLVHDILSTLGLGADNPAASDGSHWMAGTHQFASTDPGSAEPIATVGGASHEAYERVIAAAHARAKAWRLVPAPQRGEIVRLIAMELRRHKDALGSLVSLETGKIKAEGDGEVQEMIDIADFAVGQSRMLYGKTMHSERPHHRMYEQWHPLGVVGVITAFNFPVAVWSWNAFIAAVAGNAVVWKPSAKAPLAAVAVQRIIERVLAQTEHRGVFSLLVSDDDTLSEALVADARVALVSFTGSSAVGRRVAETVSRRMGKYLLECSGNNAVIVDETADLELAVRAILFGAVGTAGQRCTTTRRLIAHEAVYDEMCRRLASAYRSVRIGHPLEPGVLMGPLIDAAAVERYAKAIAELKSLGADIVYGGNVLERPGYFVEPTLVHAKPEWPIVQHETFAPILYALRYSSLEEAIAINNGVPQGLSSSLFTRDLRRAERFLSAAGSDCGIANVNVGTSGAEIGGAFGGEKETGGGREAGSDAWQAYMRRQTNTINWGTDLPL